MAGVKLRSCGSLVQGNDALLQVKAEPGQTKEERKAAIAEEVARKKQVGSTQTYEHISNVSNTFSLPIVCQNLKSVEA